MNTKLKWGSVVLIIAILIASIVLVRTQQRLSEIDTLTEQTPVPTINEEEKTITFSLYFPNSIQDPGFMDCRVVRPTNRTVPYTVGVAQASINELIKGLTAEELSNGFVTQINPDTRIQSLVIKDGVATIDLSKELSSKNVGLCAGQFIKAQIEQTLLQFPTIKTVVVSIDGDKEFVQP